MVWYGMVWYGMDWHVKVFVWKYLFLALQHSFPYQTEELVHNCFKYNTSSPNPMMVANVTNSREDKQLPFYGLCSARHGMGRDDQTERRRWEKAAERRWQLWKEREDGSSGIHHLKYQLTSPCHPERHIRSLSHCRKIMFQLIAICLIADFPLQKMCQA